MGNEVTQDVYRDEDQETRISIHRLLSDGQLFGGTVSEHDEIRSLVTAVAHDVSIPRTEVGMRVNRMLDHTFPPSIFLVVKVNRVIRGLIISETGDTANTRHVGWLRMEVHPDYRSQGLGKILIEGILWAARDEAIKRLEITSYSDNPRARDFFLKNGFHIEGHHPFARYNPGKQRYVDTYTLARLV